MTRLPYLICLKIKKLHPLTKAPVAHSRRKNDSMKKDQISAIIEANRKIHTDKLKSYVDDLIHIEEERELTKKMYFWNPGMRASERRFHEKRRNICIHVRMKDLTVHYSRDYTETCHHVYASDNLYCDEADSFTLADIKKLTAGFETILEKREKNSITKEVCEV